MEKVSIIGLDLAKRSFQAHGPRADGGASFRKKLSRDKVLAFFVEQSPCVVAVEACGSASLGPGDSRYGSRCSADSAPMSNLLKMSASILGGGVATENCSVENKGAVHRQTSVATDAGATMKALKPFLSRLRRVGHEADSLSPWLHPELTALGLPAVCLDTRHVHAAMSAQRNKIDATDTLGIAQIVHTGRFNAAFIRRRALLWHVASADAAAQSQTQISRHRKHDPPLAQGLRHSLEGNVARRV